jgi:hypothetical protein
MISHIGTCRIHPLQKQKPITGKSQVSQMIYCSISKSYVCSGWLNKHAEAYISGAFYLCTYRDVCARVCAFVFLQSIKKPNCHPTFAYYRVFHRKLYETFASFNRRSVFFTERFTPKCCLVRQDREIQSKTTHSYSYNYQVVIFNFTLQFCILSTFNSYFFLPFCSQVFLPLL